MRGLLCFAPIRSSGASRFVLTERWLGKPLPEVPPAKARTELVCHYLRHYGPSSVGSFAKWAGISPAYARASWALTADKLVTVPFGKRRLSLLADDEPVLYEAELPQGVRLLPPYDPYLAPHDKSTLVPDKTLHARIWRIVGNPGVVLVDGEISGVWRPRKRGKILNLSVELFRRVSPSTRRQIGQEASRLARLRDSKLGEIQYA